MTFKKFKTEVLIIGSGPAGYSAAIYAARSALNPILVSGSQPGGQLTITADVENYPGFAETIQGPWLMEQMKQQSEKAGTEFINDTIKNVELTKNPFIASGDSGNVYEAKSIIIATGAQAKWLGLESEKKYMGFGVSGCATCDGFFYKNKEVIVVGGGNTAVEEALYLTNHASKVTLIHRRDSLRAEKILQERLFNHPKIHILWDTVLLEVLGTDKPLSVEGAKIKNLKTGREDKIKIDGIFIAIGHKPNTELFKGSIDMDDEGYIITHPDSTKTSTPGIFASGDVQDKIYRQAVTAAGTGCMAALEVSKFLETE
ncbi:thioredoxin-disulfide reductase [Rickettsiales endosymbiont of Trichoplax sp. H2]|uniref:thioredoxin-disulfide reductase n=1 Tax=Rickettsiales endosymbiont of Trichoplax sp. H2 TaxID=2021221 RepID=UPI0012B1E975|nr:thioredoxin-disulfide reductase [Rickettsiales endosymbiont of Trichoplax sp. H2]MSO14277.1 Thioredoxin reductase [Rickettsiales endosymbiont of Trichoplax sp. H2]